MNDIASTGLVVDHLTKDYVGDGYVVRALDEISFSAAGGELIVLLGPSGSGKTTLLSCLGGMLTPSSGSIRLGDVDVTAMSSSARNDYRKHQVGFVFQGFNLIPSLNARENVAIPLIVSGRARRRDAFAAADEMIDRVGLTDRARHKPSQLSGGQQQRVAVARGLVGDPPILIADEPTANLDYIQAEAIIALLRELRARGRVIVVSTHDARLVPIADRVVDMTSSDGGDADDTTTVTLARGDLVFRQGTHADLVYVIDQGEVEIVRELVGGETERLATLGAGQYFGELGAMLGFPRSATARAVTAVELTALTPTSFQRRYQGSHGKRA